MPHKCYLCPKKAATLSDDALKCTSCGVFYHPSCAKRGKPDANNVFTACCGNFNKVSEVDEEDRHSDAASVLEDDEEDLKELDNSARILYKLLSKKIDNNYNQFHGSIDKINAKVKMIEERLDTLEDNALLLSEDIITEIYDRKSRENNFIIYNSADSKNAETSDKQMVIDLLSSCDEIPSFNINNIIVSRIGNKFVKGSNRPLKVTLPSNEDVHWIFHNKKALCKDDLSIAADLTRKQRNYLAHIIKELKKRKENGEDGLFIKYIRNVPTIAVNKSKMSIHGVASTSA